MTGILKIAFKLLVNDKAKFAALIVGITFAMFLMVQLTSIFAGILQKASANVINVGAPFWVMDPAVNNPLNSIPMPDYVLDSVRSIDGVKYAVPLYSSASLVKRNDGVYQPVTVLGLDDTTLVGRPQLLQGKIEDIYGENAFIVVKDNELPKLGNITLGTTFELNDHRGVIVGIAQVTTSGLFGMPTLYTTYRRAIQYIPNQRFTTAYILVEPKSDQDIAQIKAKVAALGYLGLTKEEFIAADFQLLQVSNRGGHQYPDHDHHQLSGRPVHRRPDLLYLCPGKSAQVRRPESHRRQKLRARLHDLFPGLFHRLHRLWPGSRPFCPAH